jgi:hypothetical protein
VKDDLIAIRQNDEYAEIKPVIRAAVKELERLKDSARNALALTKAATAELRSISK